MLVPLLENSRQEGIELQVVSPTELQQCTVDFQGIIIHAQEALGKMDAQFTSIKSLENMQEPYLKRIKIAYQVAMLAFAVGFVLGFVFFPDFSFSDKVSAYTADVLAVVMVWLLIKQKINHYQEKIHTLHNQITQHKQQIDTISCDLLGIPYFDKEQKHTSYFWKSISLNDLTCMRQQLSAHNMSSINQIVVQWMSRQNSSEKNISIEAKMFKFLINSNPLLIDVDNLEAEG